MFDLDDEFPSRDVDPLGCPIGKLRFPTADYDDDHILDFWGRYQSIVSAPECLQCLFRTEMETAFASSGVDVCGRAQRERHKDKKGFVDQARPQRDKPSLVAATHVLECD